MKLWTPVRNNLALQIHNFKKGLNAVFLANEKLVIFNFKQ